MQAQASSQKVSRQAIIEYDGSCRVGKGDRRTWWETCRPILVRRKDILVVVLSSQEVWVLPENMRQTCLDDRYGL